MRYSNELTDRQREMLNFIKQFIAEKQYPPTVREIGDGLGISSPNGVHGTLRSLERKGAIVRAPNASRSIRVIDGAEPRGIPLLSGQQIAEAMRA